MSYNNNRRIKYNYVLNITGDVEIARKARGWSLSRIEQTFGVSTSRTYYNKTVTILEKPPKFKPLTKRQRELRRKRIQWYYDSLKETPIIYVSPPLPKPPTPIPHYKPTTIREFGISEFKNNDYSQHWSNWARMENYPDEFVEIVKDINLQNNLKKDDSFGWAVLYYMYIHNLSLEYVLNYLTPSRLIGDWYEDDLRAILEKESKRK